jgi:hypothetical protein
MECDPERSVSYIVLTAPKYDSVQSESLQDTDRSALGLKPKFERLVILQRA